MAKGDVTPGISARLEALLMAAKPADLSERQWCLRGKVSTSFFTDIRSGTDPSIDRVERMANAIGLRLSDLVEGAQAQPAAPAPALPSEAQLAAMIDLGLDAGVTDATPRARIAQIVAPIVREQLRLFRSPGSPPAKGEAHVRGTTARSRPATRKSGKAAPRTT